MSWLDVGHTFGDPSMNPQSHDMMDGWEAQLIIQWIDSNKTQLRISEEVKVTELNKVEGAKFKLHHPERLISYSNLYISMAGST